MASYLQALLPFLPQEYVTQVNDLPDSTKTLLDVTLRFAAGAECPREAGSEVQAQWAKQQPSFAGTFDWLKASSTSHKRSREDDGVGQPNAKRTRSLDNVDDDAPKYTLHAISVSSPIRKKVNITIYESSIRFTNPNTNATELSIPMSSLKRAFLLPTRGKTKPHWTVLIMSSDTPLPTGKAAASASGATKEDLPQITFGVDATPPSFITTDHTTSPPSDSVTHPKGTEILPFLNLFLSHLPFRTLEPSTAVFRSALSAGDGSASVEGYRGAKGGALWFFSQGILWDGKPCEFWPLSELVGGRRNGKGQVDVDLGGAEGVRTVSATGRSCSVIVSRKVASQVDDKGGEDEEIEDDRDESIDTDIGMVDGKEQEAIARWVKKHRHLFGVVPVESETGEPADKVQATEDTSDEDDSDFADDTSSDGGSPTNSSDEGSEDGNSDDEASEDLGSGSERSEDGEEEEEDQGSLDPAHHPLMRSGAMPRMSQAAMNNVVKLVEEDLLGGSSSLERRAANNTGESGDEEEDELED